MEFKAFASEKVIHMLDNCMTEIKNGVWHLDAINPHLLLEQVVLEDESFIWECFEEDVDPEDDLYSYTCMYLSNFQNRLLIDEDKKDESSTSNSQELDQQKEDEKSEKHKDTGSSEKSDTSKNKEKEFKYESVFHADMVLMDEKSCAHKYPMSEDGLKIFFKVNENCIKMKVNLIKPIHITAAMFELEVPVLKEMCGDLGVSFKASKQTFLKPEIYSIGIIPYELSGFLNSLNEKVNPQKPCEILMRDKETEQLWNILLKMNKCNAVIIGEAGVGKSALIEKLTYDIVTGNCPEQFKGFTVINLDINSLIAGTSYRGDSEERIRQLIEFLESHDNVILFIDEVHTMLGAGSCFEGEMDLSNALKPILARGDTKVIGATTEAEYEAYFARDAALSRRFERIVVEEPEASKVYPMIKNKIRVLSKYHKVKISKAIVEYTIMIANCFAFDKKNPDKTLDLIDRSMVVASRKGLTEVDRECVLANFDIFYELYEGMGIDARKEVAYHEAGHYLVGKMSGKLTDIRMLAVSIMPAEFYLGVTCYENRKDRMPFRNKDYYIDLLAFDLGGRVAEKKFRRDHTSGAGQDLDNATRLAFNIVTKYGMSSSNDERNNIFLNTPNYPMFSEKSKNLVNAEVQELINIAYKRAESIIDEYRGLLDILVEKLLVKQIMSESELDRLCQNYMKRKKK